MNLNLVSFLLMVATLGFGYLTATIPSHSIGFGLLTLASLLGFTASLAVASVNSPFMRRRFRKDD